METGVKTVKNTLVKAISVRNVSMPGPAANSSGGDTAAATSFEDGENTHRPKKTTGTETMVNPLAAMKFSAEKKSSSNAATLSEENAANTRGQSPVRSQNRQQDSIAAESLAYSNPLMKKQLSMSARNNIAAKKGFVDFDKQESVSSKTFGAKGGTNPFAQAAVDFQTDQAAGDVEQSGDDAAGDTSSSEKERPPQPPPPPPPPPPNL
jgi:hypothetical protein